MKRRGLSSAWRLETFRKPGSYPGSAGRAGAVAAAHTVLPLSCHPAASRTWACVISSSSCSSAHCQQGQWERGAELSEEGLPLLPAFSAAARSQAALLPQTPQSLCRGAGNTVCPEPPASKLCSPHHPFSQQPATDSGRAPAASDCATSLWCA